VNITLTLNQILALVGKLDDTPGNETARERFRLFLKENVHEVGQIRDYIEECLRSSGDQYNRALQDLVNYLGDFLGFDVAFGRYKGVQDQIGFDGHWKSPKGFHIVIEVKTTEVYAIKTATLVGYIDRLISEKNISNWNCVLGLYVVGRPEPSVQQVENAIIAEKRTDQLRIISAESLLSLAEMMNEYDVSHEDILALIRPSGPKIDPIVDLIARLVAEPKSEELLEPEKDTSQTEPPLEGEVAYWLTPVRTNEKRTAELAIQTLVGQEHVYAFGDRTPGRKRIKPGDLICFYATGKGVVAHAQVISSPEKKPHPLIVEREKYAWTFRLNDAVLYLDKPIVITADVRSGLDAFRGRDPNNPWAWFVQATHKLTEHDFNVLVRSKA
jgi:EVE domain